MSLGLRRALAWGIATVVGATSAGVAALPRDELFGNERKKLRLVPGEPGSGVPVESQIRGANPAALKAPLPVRPRDTDESTGVGELEKLFPRYRAAHEAMAHTMAQQLTLDGVEGRRALEQRYEQKIRGHQAKARRLRAQAIARYEDFLELHPDDVTWTPEIMFRLGELHFESSSERLARQEEAFEKELEAYQIELEKNPAAAAPTGPSPDYQPAIAMYRGVVQGFPTYHLGDAALYMMGTLLYEMEEFDQSRQAYLALACANNFEPPRADGADAATLEFENGAYDACTPYRDDSQYAPEAWLRIGEVHYDLDELDPALQAYAQAAKDPEGDLYDEALIRMAWTLYLMREFEQAAVKFDEFIRYADAAKAEGRDEGGAIGLRDDGVKYLAKTYAEEDWNNNGRRDRAWGFARLDRDYADRGAERHVPEVYAALGDLFAFQTDFAKAIDIWQTTLNRWPLASAAPKIQSRVLAAYEMLQDKTGATVARDALATNYLRGSDWFYANESDPDVIEEALALAETALVATAVDHHATAQALRAAGDPQATAEYAIAARAYEAYLERFPDTPSSYEYRFNFAESLYYSGRFLAAAEQYALVRDSNLDNRLQEDAASGTVLAYEGFVDGESQSGQLSLPALPKQGSPGPFDNPKSIPAVMTELQAAYDRFVQVIPDSEQTPSMMYLAGVVSQRYHHFSDAEGRFTAVIDQHCGNNVAINAGQAIIDAYVAREDLKGAREWTEKLMAAGCGEGDEREKFAGELKTIGNAVRFQEATLLYEAGEFEAAADRYVALVDQAPDDPNADRALNNAAVAYENIGRFASASQTYKRIYSRYPDSEFADDALLRTGFNHSRFFQYEDAVQSYLVLAQDERYKESEHRENALWNAADLLDNLQEYKRSAELFARFAANSEDSAKAADASFRAAAVLGKTTDPKATIAAYERFVGQYGSNPTYADRVVEAQLRIGEAYAALGNRKRAEEYYRNTVSTFTLRSLKPATEAADFPSEAQFLLAEYALADVLATKVTSTGKRMEREVKALTDRLQVAAKAYDDVFPYRRLDWVLAAMYRRGFAFETWAINIRGAPVPKQLKEHSEPWFAYKDLVDQFAGQAEAKAITLYEETVKRAKEYNLANDWTRSAVERLNIYKPEQYPLLRQPAVDLQLEALP